MMRALSCRLYFGDDFIDPQILRHGFGRTAGVAGEHHDAKAIGAKRSQRLGRGILDGIAYGKRGGKCSVGGEEHYGAACRPHGLNFGPQCID